MEDRSTIFRPEAVENRARLQAPGDIVRIGATWTTWAFWALVTALILTLVAGSQIEIDRYAPGITASGPSGRVLVLIPATHAPDVGVGDLVDLATGRSQVVSVGEESLLPAEARSRYGVYVTGASLVLVTSADDGRTLPDTARVRVGSEPVLVALVPGLKALFGNSDA